MARHGTESNGLEQRDPWSNGFNDKRVEHEKTAGRREICSAAMAPSTTPGCYRGDHEKPGGTEPMRQVNLRITAQGKDRRGDGRGGLRRGGTGRDNR